MAGAANVVMIDPTADFFDIRTPYLFRALGDADVFGEFEVQAPNLTPALRLQAGLGSAAANSGGLELYDEASAARVSAWVTSGNGNLSLTDSAGLTTVLLNSDSSSLSLGVFNANTGTIELFNAGVAQAGTISSFVFDSTFYLQMDAGIVPLGTQDLGHDDREWDDPGFEITGGARVSSS